MLVWLLDRQDTRARFASPLCVRASACKNMLTLAVWDDEQTDTVQCMPQRLCCNWRASVAESESVHALRHCTINRTVVHNQCPARGAFEDVLVGTVAHLSGPNSPVSSPKSNTAGSRPLRAPRQPLTFALCAR